MLNEATIVNKDMSTFDLLQKENSKCDGVHCRIVVKS